MNKIESFWQSFCEAEGLQNVRYTEAFQFGEKVDYLANLVVQEKKTATCSSYPLYQLDGDPLPKVGDYQIVLNSLKEPVAIIKSVAIDIYPFKEVPVDFALQEGVDTYEEWKEVHTAFFSRLLPKYQLEFTEDMLTVCDQFKKVFP